MVEAYFNGIKVSWEQVGYLQSVLSPQQFIQFLQMETPKTTSEPIFSPKKHPQNTPLFGQPPFG